MEMFVVGLESSQQKMDHIGDPFTSLQVLELLYDKYQILKCFGFKKN